MSDTGTFIGTGVAPSLSSVELVGSSIRVHYSEPMTNDADLVDPANYTITPTGGGDAVTVLSVAPGPNTYPSYVDLGVSNPTTAGSGYDLDADVAITDAAGNPWDGVTLAFLGFGSGAVVLDELGIIEAFTGIFGEEMAEVGGFRMTRLAAAVTEGDTTFHVESTLGWPEEGTFAADGVKYTYTSKILTAFYGISHVAAGAVVSGAATDHRDEAAVVDLSREYSGIDLLRRAFLVNYAEGDDLNALARNLGVNRPPIFTDDDQFREVIKAVAYNPKATVYGLELALEALMGVGNYEVYEDLIQFPNTVFMRVDTSIFIEDTAAGRAFLNPRDWGLLASAQDRIALAETPITVESVILKDLDELFEFTALKPSAVTYEYWEGETPGDAFTYIGSESEAQVTVSSGTGIQMISAAGGTVAYEMLDTQGARITQDSYVEISSRLMIPTAAAPLGTDKNQASVSIKDGAVEVNVGVDNTGIGLFSSTGGGFLGATFATSLNTWYEVTVKKFGQDYVELWLDDNMISRVDYSLFVAASVDHQVEWGIRGVPLAGMEVWVRQIGFEIRTQTDYWNARGATGSVATAWPTYFTDGAFLLTAGDIGKRLVVSRSSVSNPQGGNNNGAFLVDSYVSPGVVGVVGLPHIDAATTANPDQVTVEDEEGFTYPDDLGKQIVLSGSSLGNNGTYTITQLIEPGTLVDFSTYDTPITGAKTNICKVTGAPPFVAEPNLEYHLLPVFVTESPLDWELSDASSFAGTTVTLRNGLWVNGLVMEVRYTNVLSAQLLEDAGVGNMVIDTGPPVLYENYPFYLADPLGLVAAYMDDLTAAGVIPEFESL